MISPMLAWHERLSSTIDEAHRAAGAGAPHGFAVAARVQTAGRGTRGQPWDSSAGGLWMSVILRPSGTGPLEAVSLRAGLALAARIESYLGPGEKVAIKWPNDLLLGEKKVAGILCEARWQGDQLSWIVASFGLNVRNPIPLALEHRATRLADHGVALGPSDLAEPLREAVAGVAHGAGVLSPELMSAFAQRDWLRGRTLSQPDRGVADGITETGRLRIQRPDGTVVSGLGTVRLAEP